MSAAPTTWLVIAGGGTGGHLVPGLAVADEFVGRGIPPGAIHFLGSSRGLEARLLPPTRYPHTLLPGRGIQRRFTFANVGAVVGILRAVVAAIALLRRHRPAAVVGLGGYASVPGAIAAIVLRVPLVLAEQNAVPSLANRLAGRFARAAAVSFPETDLPRASVTGNPVRAEVLAVDRSADRDSARRRLGVEGDRRLIAAFGGSLGAGRINEALLVAAAQWRDRDDLAIRHIAGSRDHDDLSGRMPVDDLDLLQYDLVEYEHEMATVLAAADVLVCRAGASTVAEVAVVGVPSVLVPLPGAPGDHQTANARAFETAGASVMVPDSELDGARVVEVVEHLLADPASLARMEKAAGGLARHDAAARVADLVVGHADRPAPTDTEVSP